MCHILDDSRSLFSWLLVHSYSVNGKLLKGLPEYHVEAYSTLTNIYLTAFDVDADDDGYLLAISLMELWNRKQELLKLTGSKYFSEVIFESFYSLRGYFRGTTQQSQQ